MTDRRRLSRSTSLALVALTPALVAATPYDANPTLGAPGSPVIDGTNDGEWGPEHLIYRGLANDDPRSLGGNWTMHETPWDLTHLFAAWDDAALYLAWQYVDVTDVVDPANAGSAGGSSPGRMDLIQWIALDTVSGRGAALDMWGKNAGEPYWTGPDLPDHQIYVASNLWQGYVSTAVDDVFPGDDGGVHYFSLEAAGIEIAVGSGLAVDALLGVDDADHALDEAAQRDFLSLGHSPARDTFYEIRIPFAALGLDAAGFAASGLGVMIGQGEGSCLDTLPHDPATHDTPGTSPSNSPLEWGDVDTFTVPFARVATASGEPVTPNLDAGPPPDPTGDAGPAADVGGATGEPDAGPRPDPERDAATGPVGGDDRGAPPA
ncbi:hypothetical protein L6V77_33965, partial [Myxococcota bacterium]|nr:hypothetical protein [Myxococcota bacterium]